MKFLLSYILYKIGDLISITTMKWGNGFGYTLYSKVMHMSVNLDTNNKIWKPVKSKRKKK